MLTQTANRDARLSFWLRVREYAVPPSMIELATARRCLGDWAGACAAAGVDVDFSLRSVTRDHGQELTARVRADLRHLAPDLLRWHMPRIAPDGLLRPGLTIALARYDVTGRDGDCPVLLVARTAPSWADAGQRISLALWDGSHPDAGAGRHPHPRPHQRFRLDLHRHVWDARRSGELRIRSGADRPPGEDHRGADPALVAAVPPGYRCAVDRWAAEGEILLRDEGRATGTVTVRLGARHRVDVALIADRDGAAPPAMRIAVPPIDGDARARPVLPDAATWALPDLDLLRTGAVDPGQLHPLVASALIPEHASAGARRTADETGRPRLVECRGATHRIGLVEGVLAPLDHDPAEIRREELLAALTGSPLPCLRAIDDAHRRPDCLTGVRERLDHGDTAGALAVVEGLLGPEALLRAGALRDELTAAAQQRITHGLYRAGLIGPGPGATRPDPRHHRGDRTHPRRTTGR